MHALGCTLLINIYKKARKKSVQQFYLICHSFIIAIKNVLALILVILELLPNNEPDLAACREYLSIIFGVVTYCYYAFMFFLTADRLVGIVLNFKYPIFWDIHKAKHLVAITVIFNVLICLGLSFAYRYLGEEVFRKEFYDIFYAYVPTILDVGFLVLAVTTYTVIFIQYSKSSKLPDRHMSTRHQRNSSKKARYISRKSHNNSSSRYNNNSSQRAKSQYSRGGSTTSESHLIFARSRTNLSLLFRSRFLVSILLISSFLLFSVIPGLLVAYFAFVDATMSEEFLFCVYVSFKVCDGAEAVIYIFLQDNVRKLLLRKLSTLQLCNCYRSRAKEGVEELVLELDNLK